MSGRYDWVISGRQSVPQSAAAAAKTACPRGFLLLIRCRGGGLAGRMPLTPQAGWMPPTGCRLC